MFLSCGDALVDLFISDGLLDSDAAVFKPGATKPGALCLHGAAGGSPMNVACGLARLGHSSEYFTRLSRDVFGNRIRDYLTENQVGISMCADTDLNTTLAIIEKQADGSANYVFHKNKTADVSIAEDDLPEQLPPAVKAIHLGSYCAVVEPSATALSALVKRESRNVVVSYDPNLRITFEPDLDKWRESFATLSTIATVVKASDEDIALLYGTGAAQQQRFIEDCFAAGARLVFVTMAAEGAIACAPDGSRESTPTMATSVVDTVGAGDSFQAAMLHWLTVNDCLDGATINTNNVDLSACLRFAVAAAGVTCSRAGADLPRLGDIVLPN